jgi:hypothetical protein
MVLERGMTTAYSMDGGIYGEKDLVLFVGSHLLLANLFLLHVFLDLCNCTIPFESLLFSSANRSADLSLFTCYVFGRRIAGWVRWWNLLYIIYQILSKTWEQAQHNFGTLHLVTTIFEFA